ncbi:hypothetical protein COOONC_08323, partial [Cooperia oncophora]
MTGNSIAYISIGPARFLNQPRVTLAAISLLLVALIIYNPDFSVLSKTIEAAYPEYHLQRYGTLLWFTRHKELLRDVFSGSGLRHRCFILRRYDYHWTQDKKICTVSPLYDVSEERENIQHVDKGLI